TGGGSIPGAPDDSGGRDDDDDDDGTTGGGSIPGAPDDSGGRDPPSDDPGIDPTDPSDAPSASPPDQGIDPTDPRDAPSASPPSPAPDPPDDDGGIDPTDPSDAPSASPPASDPDPTPPDGGSDDASGGGQTDTTGSNRGASGDIDFRFADQSDAIDSDPEFRTDSGARAVAEELLARGQDVGDRVGGGAADVIGADPAERQVLQSFASAGTTIPGSAAVLGADAADAAGFVTQPARGAVEPGARLGVDDFADIGAETATRTGEIGAAAGDAVIEGADTVFDINFDRRAEGEGAAISFTDDPQVRQQLAGNLAFGAASLGAAGPAGSATRGAASAAARGARSAADVGSSGARRLADDLDAGSFVDDTRAQQQIGDQRPRGGRDTGSTRIDADDIRDRPSDPNQGPAAFPDPQGRFEGGAGFSRGSPDRGTVNGPADVDPSGSGDGFGYRSVEREVQTAQQPPGVDSPSDDLRDVVDVEQRLAGGGGASARFSATGAGAAGVGPLSQTADPTGIAPESTVTGGPRVDPANDPTSVASTTAVTGTQQVDPTNDPTGIDPGTLDQFGEQRLGGGTLPGSAAGGGIDTDVPDGSDPTNVAPPDSETDTDGDTDTFAPTDTGSDTDQPPASDTDQPPVTDTPAPPVVDVPPVTDQPPVTDTPPTTTPRPPARPPAFPPARPPVRRRPRRPPEPEEERDRQRQRDTGRDAEFRLFETADDGGPAVGFGAETFAALATGPFEQRQPAAGSTDEFFSGELPAAGFLNPDDDDEEGVAFVSGLFGLGLGLGLGGGPDDA
ncbi:hypothetical protein PM023_16245, partial [Halorubrum ezzemoulense]|nr:hypothetical protein [Halorubrum ezzemoulense]